MTYFDISSHPATPSRNQSSRSHSIERLAVLPHCVVDPSNAQVVECSFSCADVRDGGRATGDEVLSGNELVSFEARVSQTIALRRQG